MSLLYVVRHGQASFHGPHYDQLSTLGEEQGRIMGAYWARLGLRWDRVFVGPKLRHAQTYRAVAEAYNALSEAPLPEATMLPAFDEHQGPGVVRTIMSRDPGSETGHRLLPGHVKSKEQVNAYFARFQEITLRWVAGAVNLPEFESWDAFRKRVEQGLGEVMRQGGRGSRVLVFTSGGPAAVTAGYALGLPAEKVLRLSWNVRNGAYTECLFRETGRSQSELSLVGFNVSPHFTRKDLITLI